MGGLRSQRPRVASIRRLSGPVAAVDIGTNSTKLLIVDESGAEIIRTVRVTGLGRGVDGAGRLAADAIDRTVAVLADYGSALRRHSVDSVRAVATSASRDAANRDEFFDAAEQALGVRPEVIAGTEEAMLSFAGAASVAADPTHAVVVDIGGGSTEFVSDHAAVSVDIGSIRLTERCLPDHPATTSQLAQGRTEAARIIATRDLPHRGSAIGVAGTWTSLSAMHHELTAYDSRAVHRSQLTLDDVRLLVARLARLSLEEKLAIPSLDPGRAPVILGGTIVAEAALQALALDQITISERDLLDGVCSGLLTG